MFGIFKSNNDERRRDQQRFADLKTQQIRADKQRREDEKRLKAAQRRIENYQAKNN
jgi:hypothetical protein